MVGTFPLNVQPGSPQYTISSQITPSSSTTTITITIINTGQVTPVSNAYYTIQNEDGSKWCTFYVESWTRVGEWVPADAPITFTGSCTYSSSNTSDVFPEGSTCWCIWCKEYYDSLITQIGGGGNTVKVSQLEWDTNLIIPDGKAIESASGEVGIIGDASISGNINTEGVIISDKQLVIGKNVGNATVTLAQISSQTSKTYTSPDFNITGLTENVQYLLPSITYSWCSRYYATSTFRIQAKLDDGTYVNVASISAYVQEDCSGGSTTPTILPANTTALRYTISATANPTNHSVSPTTAISLIPIPVY